MREEAEMRERPTGREGAQSCMPGEVFVVFFERRQRSLQ
jgi:hypothetical protein